MSASWQWQSLRRPPSVPSDDAPRRAPRADDASLISRVAAGDTSALGALYDRHARALLVFLTRVTSTDEAEDLVQTTFVRAAQAAATFRPADGAARAWLFGIAAKLVQERKRSFVRRARALFRATVHEPTRSADAERADVARALAELSEAKRTVVVLAEIEGFSCQEIATMLDIPIGTVWTRLHHARTELRAFFDKGET